MTVMCTQDVAEVLIQILFDKIICSTEHHLVNRVSDPVLFQILQTYLQMVLTEITIEIFLRTSSV